MRMKRRIVFLLLAAACLLLAVGCGNDVESPAAHTDETPIGTAAPHTDKGAPETAEQFTEERPTAPDPDDDLNGPVYTVRPFLVEEDPMASEIESAMAAKEAKLIWAEDCFSETPQEVKTWHYTTIDCNELYEELLKELFPDVTVEKREDNLESTHFELKSGDAKFLCVVNNDGYGIRFTRLPAGLGEEIIPKEADWLARKTGVEQSIWSFYDRMRIDGEEVYTGRVDGIQIGALSVSPVNNKLQGYYGITRSDRGSVSIESPISVGETAGTVKLSDGFSQEELRTTLEYDFNPDEPVITVYHSCEVCYLIHQVKGLLVPVWWVKGVRYNYETGDATGFEIVYDVETGSRYDMGGA